MIRDTFYMNSLVLSAEKIARRHYEWLRKIPFFVWTSFVVYLSLMPSVRVEASFSHEVQSYDIYVHAICYGAMSMAAVLAFCKTNDVIMHGVVYGGISATAVFAFLRRNRAGLLDRLNVALGCAILGNVLEIAQATLPGINRACSVDDMVLNTLGAFVGSLVVPNRFLPKPNISET